MTRTQATAAITVAFSAFLASCTRPSAASSTPPSVASQDLATPVVAVVPVGTENFTRTAVLTGEFRPYQSVEISAKIAGYLKSINFDVGDRVQAGQLVAVLEMPELNDELTRAGAERKRADSELLRARGELERAEANRELVDLSYTRLAAVTKSEPGLIARQELDEAMARKRSADAQVTAARAALASAEHLVDAAKASEQKTRTMLDYARITVPFAGMITKRYTDPGAMIQSGPLLRLAEISRLRLVVPVPESQVPHIALGTPVEIKVTSLSRVVRGTVARFTGDVQLTTRTMDVEVDVPNPDSKLVPGMYADAVITIEKREHARSIPVQALLTREGKRFVMVVRDNTIEERPLETGIETAERLEVVSGVQPGEMVIVSNKGQLKDGQRVQARQGGVS